MKTLRQRCTMVSRRCDTHVDDIEFWHLQNYLANPLNRVIRRQINSFAINSALDERT